MNKEMHVQRKPTHASRPGLGAAALLALAALSTPPALNAQAAGYLTFDRLTSEIQALAGPNIRVESIGQSREGRDIWLVEIANPSGTPVDQRPGILVAANFSGDHLVGSSLALETIRYFSENASDPEVQETLNDHVVYVVPRMNPDGAEAMFGSLLWGRTTNTLPYDGDNDGRTDEDGPEDLNGDGVITVMRVEDPAGRYMLDPDDPRLMKVADPAEGETGTHTLYWEGTDADGDGFINEDPAGGVDIDRNFQHLYPYYEADAGLHMVSEPESRALMDWVIANRNVAAILTFGHTDNLVTPPNGSGNLAGEAALDLVAFADASLDDIFDVGSGGAPGTWVDPPPDLRGAQPGSDNNPDSGRRPAETVDGDDIPYYERISDVYREVTGIEKTALQRAPEGAFFQFGYFQYGVPSFSTPGWGIGDVEEGDSPDATVLAWLEAEGVDGFTDWTAFTHPSLGPVEIGGFHPYDVVNPPATVISGLGAAHGVFLTRLAGMLPEMRFASTEVTALGGGLFRVEAEIVNTGYLPSSMQQGVVNRAVNPTTVQIQVPPETIVAGSPKTEQTRKVDGSGVRERFMWVVRGQAGQEVELTLLSQKAGRDTTTVTLR